MRDDEVDAVRSQLSVDESQRGRVTAMSAVNTAHLITAYGELIRVRIAGVGAPSSAIIVGILRSGRLHNTKHDGNDQQLSHEPSLNAAV
jgi:hypothetical protein